ncbi:MAG: WecB/TagA/CpsF family glycosyltransferase [Endomicrobia bacterium]|nr:WecB/TagA/CpsF family glycosyltransferase [Endomicrobiia bacterium]MCX7940983.1 WecB/TagA/CpsF family glycosyltransferase [Endomicrobiia bacterium]MDW8056172.1 WecB/TagA/CpsF family glycosyltransferase [Elusimicrobiota bacterium]
MYVFKVGKLQIYFAASNEIIQKLEKIIQTCKHPCQVVTLNLLIYLQSKFDLTTKKALENSELIICDSSWISLICSIFSLRHLKYLPGVEFINGLCKFAKEKNYTIFLFGGRENVVKTAAFKLSSEFGVRIVGFHHGYIFDSAENMVVERINKCVPDILLVGLPTELQESWIYKNINNLRCKLILGVGGSFDIISGRLRRAPKLFRKLRLEWYYRTLQEPWRIVRILKLPLAFSVFFFDCLISIFESRKRALS